MHRYYRLIVIACSILMLFSAFPVFAEGSNENGIWLDFSTATDEDLENAIKIIKEEQRNRLDTKIVMDNSELKLGKGKSAKITAEVIEVPDDITAGKIIWESSDPKIVTCQQGNIKGIANGNAVIKASCTLSDGTEVWSECSITVYTPVTELRTKNKKITVDVNDSAQLKIDVLPKDATNSQLVYTSSDETIASVDSNGLISGHQFGTAEITAATVDGSEKKIVFSVMVMDTDDIGKTKGDPTGTTIKLMGYRERGGDWLTPDPADGYIYVLADFLFENNSNEEITINVWSFSAICNGREFHYHFAGTLLSKVQLAGYLQAGASRRGEIAFEIPRDWQKVVVSYNDISFEIFHK